MKKQKYLCKVVKINPFELTYIFVRAKIWTTRSGENETHPASK